jgi:hypothetical protein
VKIVTTLIKNFYNTTITIIQVFLNIFKILVEEV